MATLSRDYMWDNFTLTGNTALLSDVAGVVNQNIRRVARGRFCYVETMLQDIHRIKLFATYYRYWRHLATRATTFDFYHRTALRMSSFK